MGIINRLKRGFAAFKNEYNETLAGKVFTAQYGSYDIVGSLMESDLVQACISTNARHTAKARARVVRTTDSGIVKDAWNQRLERILNQNPNPQMTGYQYLYNVRALCDEKGMALIFVDRGADGWPVGFYPIFYDSVTALVNPSDMRFCTGFEVSWGGRQYRFPLNNLIVMYRGLMRPDFTGMKNNAVYHSLDMLNISDSGTKNAIKLSSSLRGILKTTKGMIDEADAKATRDRFVSAYVSSGDSSGIAALDSSYEFTPLNIDPKTANAAVTQGYEKRVMRFFGQNDNILMNDYTEEQWTAYYEGAIEPFLISLSQATTNASFTEHERSFRNEVIYESNRMLYASLHTKLSMVALVDRELMSPNEYREVMNLPPTPDGDHMLIRKEYERIENMLNKIQARLSALEGRRGKNED